MPLIPCTWLNSADRTQNFGIPPPCRASVAEAINFRGRCLLPRAHAVLRIGGLRRLYRRPRASKPEPGHKIYPYLLRGKKVVRPNQVWAMDITYIPMKGFVYLAAVLDWFSRRALSWRAPITMEAAFCVEALEDALAERGKPEIFNAGQGSPRLGGISIFTVAAARIRALTPDQAYYGAHSLPPVRLAA